MTAQRDKHRKNETQATSLTWVVSVSEGGLDFLMVANPRKAGIHATTITGHRTTMQAATPASPEDRSSSPPLPDTNPATTAHAVFRGLTWAIHRHLLGSLVTSVPRDSAIAGRTAPPPTHEPWATDCTAFTSSPNEYSAGTLLRVMVLVSSVLSAQSSIRAGELSTTEGRNGDAEYPAQASPASRHP